MLVKRNYFNLLMVMQNDLKNASKHPCFSATVEAAQLAGENFNVRKCSGKEMIWSLTGNEL